MTIEFLTTDDPLYVLPFFAEFIPQYARDFQITRVWGCRAMGKRPRAQLIRELVCLYGAWGFTRLSSRMLRYRIAGTARKKPGSSRYYSFPQLCAAYGIPYARIGSPNSAEFIAGMKQRQPDLIISVACPFILKSELLTIPHKGSLNIHHAPLPRYKGMMPTFWQMYHGEKRVGVTVHYMAQKVDEGAVLLQDNLEIEPNETLDHLILRSKRHGAHCMAKAVQAIEKGAASGVHPPASVEGSYFTFPTYQQMQDFHRKGLRAI